MLRFSWVHALMLFTGHASKKDSLKALDEKQPKEKVYGQEFDTRRPGKCPGPKTLRGPNWGLFLS